VTQTAGRTEIDGWRVGGEFVEGSDDQFEECGSCTGAGGYRGGVGVVRCGELDQLAMRRTLPSSLMLVVLVMCPCIIVVVVVVAIGLALSSGRQRLAVM